MVMYVLYLTASCEANRQGSRLGAGKGYETGRGVKSLLRLRKQGEQLEQVMILQGEETSGVREWKTRKSLDNAS